MYTNSTLTPIQDNDLYVGLDGTQWANTNKDTIPELHKVTETPRPDEEIYIVTGFHINENYEQVWDYEAKPQVIPKPQPTLEEAKIEYKHIAKSNYINWFRFTSDNYYIAKVRTGAAVPQDIINAGLAKDEAYAEYKVNVDNCKSMEELKQLGYFE